jgi:hypothetical protein
MKLSFIILCHSNTAVTVKRFKILGNLYTATDPIQNLFKLYYLATSSSTWFSSLTYKYISPLSCNLAGSQDS